MSFPHAARTSLFVALLPLLGACSDQEPWGPGAGLGELQIHAAVNAPTISTLVVEVTAADLSARLVFNFELLNGAADGRIVIPAGPRRRITVKAYAEGGIQTHEGEVTVDVHPGPNPTVRITLRPLVGDQPIQIVLGSFTVTVDHSDATLPAGRTLQLQAEVVDVDGNLVAGTSEVVWATDAPAVAKVDAAGLVTAKLAGSAQIVASYGGVAAVAKITVVPGEVGALKMAFVTRRDGDFEIYVMNADGTGVTRLTNAVGIDWLPAWSPDGARIAFDRQPGTEEIYVMNADGSGQVNLTNNPADDIGPTWSPDGSKIAFVSGRDNDAEIYVMNADGTGVTRLTNASGDDVDPVWAPDGSKIAFMSERDGNAEIYITLADGSMSTNVSNNGAADFSAAWSPDGSRIAFVSNRTGDSEIWVVNANGTGLARLTNVLGTDWYPAWSPDGAKIAFVSERDGNSEIYAMNADGTGQINLTHDPGPDGVVLAFPSVPLRWSPDGSKIAFVSTRDGDYEIYVMNPDGTGQINLTKNASIDFAPTWSLTR